MPASGAFCIAGGLNRPMAGKDKARCFSWAVAVGGALYRILINIMKGGGYMKQFSDKFYSRMFLISAIWNFYFSLSGLLLPQLNLKLCYGEEVAIDIMNNFYSYTLYNFQQSSILLVGIGYYIVSRNVNKNHGLVLLGIIGKLFFFVYFSYMYFTMRTTTVSFLAVIGDFIFSILFAYFLVQKRK
jgi:hypothetical protein